MKKRMKSDHKLKDILILFFLSGFLGYFFDLINYFLSNGTLNLRGFFSNLVGFSIPFMPIYGFGVVLIYLLIPLLHGKHLVIKGLIYAFCISSLEFVTGIIFNVLLDMNLWDYTHQAFNLWGQTGLIQFIAWGLIALLVEFILKKQEFYQFDFD